MAKWSKYILVGTIAKAEKRERFLVFEFLLLCVVALVRALSKTSSMC